MWIAIFIHKIPSLRAGYVSAGEIVPVEFAIFR
jgi:hypothetical protein